LELCVFTGLARVVTAMAFGTVLSKRARVAERVQNASKTPGEAWRIARTSVNVRAGGWSVRQQTLDSTASSRLRATEVDVVADPRLDLATEFLGGNRTNMDWRQGSARQLQIGSTFRF
jgi:hypothetical protein